jgi:hypothetical protein
MKPVDRDDPESFYQFQKGLGAIQDTLWEGSVRGMTDTNRGHLAETVGKMDSATLRSTARAWAEELIFSPTVDEAITKLQQDRVGIAAFLRMTSGIPSDRILSAQRRAFASMPCTKTFELHGFCSYVIELCVALEEGEAEGFSN